MENKYNATIFERELVRIKDLVDFLQKIFSKNTMIIVVNSPVKKHYATTVSRIRLKTEKVWTSLFFRYK